MVSIWVFEMMDDKKMWKPTDRTLEIIQKDSVTPLEVRDVIIECFCYAHGDYEQALHILKTQAVKAGMLWQLPDRRGISNWIPLLAEVASTFRSPEIIEQNKQKIGGLLRKCSDT